MKKMIMTTSIMILILISLLVPSIYSDFEQQQEDYVDIKLPVGETTFYTIPPDKTFDHIEFISWSFHSQREEKPQTIFKTYSSEGEPSFTRVIYEHPYEYEILLKGRDEVLRIKVPESYYTETTKVNTQTITARVYLNQKPQKTVFQPTHDPQNPDYEYVIITNSTLWQTFNDEFKDWKITNDPKINNIWIVNVSDILGWRSYTVDDILGDATNESLGNHWNPDGTEATENLSIFNDTQAQIRNFLRDCYDTENTRYVLLGGNKDLVPTRQAATCASGDGCGTYDNDWSHASDMYYSNLHYPMNNVSYEYFMQSECCGYGFDLVDWGFDLYVGRALVNNVSTLNNWIGKTKNYTSGNDNGNYLSNMICCAKDNANSITDDTWLDLGGEYSASIYRQMYPISNLTWVNGQNISQAQWDIMDDYVNGNVAGWDGIHMILAAGHGDYHSGRLWDQYHSWICDNGDVPNFVYSESCLVGAFGTTTTTCVEDWMKYNSCMVAGIHNSAYGWFGASTFFVEDFLEEMFNQTLGNQTLNFCKAHQDARENTGHTLYDGVWAMIYKETNFFGDPALDWVWNTSQSDTPEFIHIDYGGNGTNVYSSNPTFNWTTISDAASYNLQVATDSGFSNIIINITDICEAVYPSEYSQNSTNVSFMLPTVDSLPTMNRLYYTRVRSYN